MSGNAPDGHSRGPTKDPHSVTEILDRIDGMASEQAEVSVEEVMHSFGPRTFGPAIIVPALAELTPIGAIPGVPSMLALIIALVAAQKMVGMKALWLPRFLARRRIDREKLTASTARLRGIARFMDRHFHGRLRIFTHAPFSQIAAGVVFLLCCCVPFLEILPFASSGPMVAIAMFGLAVLVRDGVLMLIAMATSLAAIGFGYNLWAALVGVGSWGTGGS